ncbi:MAG: peptidoglycan DD-metalloendopeptidase family protein [Alcaligenaceae bacterium]|nr:peptidoglycan DD-metalloendopeptidase family protein [Alcaligenaceae bacterium]
MPIKSNLFESKPALGIIKAPTGAVLTVSLSLLLSCSGLAGVAAAQSVNELSQQQRAAEKRRADLEKQINSVKKAIQTQETEKRDVVDRLGESERNISRINAELDRLQEQQDETEHEIVLLRRQADGQRELLAERQEDLGEQIYAQYTSGLSPWSALLSGGDAQKIGRDMGYLSYVARARARAVEELNLAILNLQKTESEIKGRQQKIERLAEQTLANKNELQKEQKKYQTELTKIEGDLKSRRAEAGRLQGDQQRLDSLIGEIGRTISQQRELARQAELDRQRLALERQQSLAREREAQAKRAGEQAALAQQQAERAASMRAQAQQSQQQALSRQRLTEIQIREVENDIARALRPEDLEQAKRRMTAMLNQREQSQQQLSQARLQQENAEIEAAKARLAKERALEAQRLEAQAREDERKARSLAASTNNGIPQGAPWPLRGSLQGQFGRTRPDTGGVWRGILIKANAGAPVKAIAGGTVVFADWMRGFGNLIIVDHGNDYMSVYGYNQSLSRKVGEAVRSGQTIARAGSTGGQVEPALYFEIRRGSQPIDPLRMLAR